VKSVRVRVGVVIVRDGRILLVNHRRMGRSYWVLPGGGLVQGESLMACAAREVREETGLGIVADRLLYLAEAFPRDGSRHTLDVILLGHLADEMGVPQAMAGWAIEQPEFVPLDDLPGLPLLPPITAEILGEAAAGFSGPMRFLGNRWVELGRSGGIASAPATPEPTRGAKGHEG
jgi:ADP-ribose pyrophosphatase YjhB (NUDIX family)